MRQYIDADAERLQLLSSVERDEFDAALLQSQRKRQTSDSCSRDQDSHDVLRFIAFSKLLYV
jgi:hypothetical protein